MSWVEGWPVVFLCMALNEKLCIYSTVVWFGDSHARVWAFADLPLTFTWE